MAPFVGAFADALPKGKVLLISNTVKIAGCVTMLFAVHPLVAYGIVGLGAAAYSPAKYGILTEYLPHPKLVIANGWMEGLTVSSIIIGTSWSITITVASRCARSRRTTSTLTPHQYGARKRSRADHRVLHLGGGLQPHIPNTGIDHKPEHKTPLSQSRIRALSATAMVRQTRQISLATTTLFWGAGQHLQFIVLKQPGRARHTLSQSTLLQGYRPATPPARDGQTIPLHREITPLPRHRDGHRRDRHDFVRNVYLAMVMLTLVGALAGFFVVPMNALLQHRGHILMGAGHSIAVQNFNENLSILMMLGVYAVLIKIELSIYTVITLFGVFVAVTMAIVRERHQLNMRSGPLPQIPADTSH